MYDRSIAKTAYSIPAEQWDATVVPDLLDSVAEAGFAVARQGSAWLILTESAVPLELARGMGIVMRRVAMPVGAQVTLDFHCEGRVRGSGRWLTLNRQEMAAFSGVAFLLDRIETVYWAADGTFILDSPYSEGGARAANFAQQFGVRATLTDVAVPAWELKRPRVWVDEGDGETVHLLARYGVPFVAGKEGLVAGKTRIEIGVGGEKGAPVGPGHPLGFGVAPEVAAGFRVVLEPLRIAFPVRPAGASARYLLNAVYWATARRI